MRGALTGGAGDDGMVQRFSLLVWPDQNPSWENTDRYPASEPRAAAWQAFRRLGELTADAAGAATDEFAPVPYLRFDEDAQGVFNEWRQALEMRLRSDNLMPALESHLAKYRKLVPSLALINHLTDEEPSARRYVVNDATYEALGVILADNPNGTLAFRDELVSLLKNLDREEQVSARGFFLTAWNGTSGYTFDRIIRGKTHIETVCLSLLGSTQPGRLAEYMRGALTGGAGDDGMVQRFSLLVWPDQNPSWENTDRYPASEPRAAAWQAFRRLDELTADAAGAATDEFAPVPYLRFDEDAQGVFNEWRQALEMRLRSDDLMPALESHLAKYRKLVPALALINHLADGGTGAISETAILRAVAFAEYLETHAKRAYAAGSEVATAAAKAILKRIRNSDLADGFTARDIYRNHWADLSDRNRPQAGLDLLNDFDWLRGEKRETGGRTSVVYRVNPRAWL